MSLLRLLSFSSFIIIPPMPVFTFPSDVILAIGRAVKSYVHLSNKEFVCITHTIEHNYISPSNAVGIQLHVSALYVDHLQVVI